MQQIQLLITIPELELIGQALTALVQQMSGASKVQVIPETPAAAPVETAPVPDPAPTPEPAAAAPSPAKAYTKDQLIQAAAKLMDQGKQAELITLLDAAGLPSMQQLQPDQYEGFAEGLRRLGADL